MYFPPQQLIIEDIWLRCGNLGFIFCLGLECGGTQTRHQFEGLLSSNNDYASKIHLLSQFCETMAAIAYCVCCFIFRCFCLSNVITVLNWVFLQPFSVLILTASSNFGKKWGVSGHIAACRLSENKEWRWSAQVTLRRHQRELDQIIGSLGTIWHVATLTSEF